MKTQTLTRFQSTQSANLGIYQSLQKLHSHYNNNCKHNLTKKKSQESDALKQDPYQCIKFHPSLRYNSHFQSTATIQLQKKGSSNSNSQQKDVNRQMKWNFSTVNKNRQNKSYLINKKFSSNLQKAEIKSQSLINNFPKINSSLKQGKYQVTKIKNNLWHVQTNSNTTQVQSQLLKTEDLSSKNKASEKQQSNNPVNTPQKYVRKSSKPINHLMKTINVFKDYKQTSYFNRSNNKFQRLQTKYSQKKSEGIKSLHRISTDQMVHKRDDVSIQISEEDEENCNDSNLENNKPEKANDGPDFGCSNIKQKDVDNDSQFLDNSQVKVLSQLMLEPKKIEKKRRKWKNLPEDFLNS